MLVQLYCWRQNGGVSGKDPGSSRVLPAEMISETIKYLVCENKWLARKSQYTAYNIMMLSKFTCIMHKF